MPVVIDFGLLQMADANWTTDERLVGRFVRVAIDRLEISPALEQDWPSSGKTRVRPEWHCRTVLRAISPFAGRIRLQEPRIFACFRHGQDHIMFLAFLGR
jgi:hypothetical protein